jgi:GH35 family endo-1,4-beta-xylanase
LILPELFYDFKEMADNNYKRKMIKRALVELKINGTTEIGGLGHNTVHLGHSFKRFLTNN